MRIYVFTEHYPNTYKPYLDVQFSELERQGHAVQIFAFGKFDARLSQRARSLAGRTTYVPETLRQVRQFAPELAGALASPWRSARTSAATLRRDRTPRQRAADLARALLLPSEPPELCLIHNLVTAKSYPFLRALYPAAPVALYFHGGEVPAAGTIEEAETRRAFALATRVFTNTRFSCAQAAARGCPAEKLAICPVGFALEDYRPGPRRHREGGALRLVSVGRLSPEKGLLWALEALALARARGVAAELKLVGDGPQRALLEDRVRGLGLGEAVRFAGEAAHEQVLAHLAKADALLLPSVPTGSWAETQACVVQEAMLMGCAVVASRMGGVPESLAPELHPLLVPPADAPALAEAIAWLASTDPVELARLGGAGARFARDRYDVRALTAQLLEETRVAAAGGAEAWSA